MELVIYVEITRWFFTVTTLGIDSASFGINLSYHQFFPVYMRDVLRLFFHSFHISMLFDNSPAFLPLPRTDTYGISYGKYFHSLAFFPFFHSDSIKNFDQ